MTNAKLVRVLAAALRAAADELDRGATSDEKPTRHLPEKHTEISDLNKARAAKILRELDSL